MHVDFKKYKEKTGFSLTELARRLYPGNSYPTAALKRITSGLAELSQSQVNYLAALAGVPVEALFEGAKWPEDDTNVLIVREGVYEARIALGSKVAFLMPWGHLAAHRIDVNPGMSLGGVLDAFGAKLRQKDY